MRTILSFIVITFFFFSCKKNKEKLVLNSEVESNKKTENDNIDIQICIDKKLEFKLYKDLSFDKNIHVINKLRPSLYYSISKENFNTLFNKQNIKCISASKAGGFSYHNIYYNDNSEDAKNVYSMLENLELNSENLNKYHDFFKRGLAFVLNSKENKITLISFNIFADNSLSKKLKAFFKTNKKDFEKVFMTTGIGTVEILIE